MLVVLQPVGYDRVEVLKIFGNRWGIVEPSLDWTCGSNRHLFVLVRRDHENDYVNSNSAFTEAEISDAFDMANRLTRRFAIEKVII